LLLGVGHEPQPLSDVRSPDATSRKTDRPDGVAFSFQVIANKIEPPVTNRAFNLFTKDDVRLALADELKPRRPKVARIVSPSLGARRAEGLTGARTCPNRSVVIPAGESEGVAPAPDPGKEVALGETGEV
jgi:hypothetical protein|tara:strand:- start:156 stop:545 length:390 start_codon:yes stop_codon:yes gene_type:complete